MTVTRDQVRAASGASETAVSDAQIDSALAVAKALVVQYVGDIDVPKVIIDEATIAAAVEKINIDQAPNGVLNQQYDIGVEGTTVPLRVSRDPMKAAKPLLDPYVSGRFFCA